MSHHSSTLLCIDLQREYFDPGRSLWVPDSAFVLANTVKLVHKARHIGTPVVHVRHVSRKPGAVTFAQESEFLEFPEDVSSRDGEYVVTKSRLGAFYETVLDARLQSLGITRLFLCGLLSFICVDTVRFMMYQNAMNAELLIKFMTRLIKGSDRKVFLILDNLRVHHGKIVKKWMADHKEQIEVIYLPSYSPKLNPDEYLN